jgi:large subunit ribosomal protein L4
MKLKVYNTQGDVTGEVEVSEEIFGAEVKTHLFWEVVRWQRAKRRAGTHSVRSRQTVSGTTAKAYKQKGTGRARHGSHKAHIFVGGAVSHGPTPRSYEFSVNKKARRAALRSALSQKVAQEKLVVVEDFTLPEIKTKRAVSALSNLKANKTLVVDVDNEVLQRSVRNLPRDNYLPVAGLNVMDLLKHDTVVLTKAALEQVQGRLG